MSLSALALVGLALVPRVVVVRDGARTILSVQSDAAAPWPLPAGVRHEDAKPLPASAFDEIDRMDAPTMWDRWEADPCPEPLDPELAGTHGARSEQGSVLHFVDAPPPPPRRTVFAHTMTDGFRVETSAPTLVVPVIPGQEVVIHVLGPSAYDAVDVPVVALPQSVEVPVSLRGSFQELYQALFEHAARIRPGVVVREFVGGPNLDKPTRVSFGFDSLQEVDTRLHVRPAAGTTQLVLSPTREPSRGGTSFEVEHPWPAPIRCLDPDRGEASMGPAVPVAPEPARPVASVDELLSVELPALGLHSAPWWRRLPPFDGGALAGGGIGLCVALLVRRRSPP